MMEKTCMAKKSVSSNRIGYSERFGKYSQKLQGFFIGNIQINYETTLKKMKAIPFV